MSMQKSTIPVIDTHEHIENIIKHKADQVGLLHLLCENHYLMADIASSDAKNAGKNWMELPFWKYLSSQANDISNEKYSLMLKNIIKRLPYVMHTSDWQSMYIALRDLYGLDQFVITDKNWKKVEDRIRNAYKERDQWYNTLLEKAGIKLLFWCYGKPSLEGPIRSVFRISDFLEKKRDLEKNTDDLKNTFSEWFHKSITEFNPIALKFGSAYSRDLKFQKVEKQKVDQILEAMDSETTFGSFTLLSDYIHHLAASHAAKQNIPIQIHTGLLAGNLFRHPLVEAYANRIERFVAEHPDTKFDIFHSSFPQWGEAITFARKYPNVYLNLCWMPSITESLTETILETAIDAVPINKIMWGGDAHSPEMAYGVLQIFKGILNRVLTRRSKKGMPISEISEWILYRSASDLYGISI